MKLFEFDRQALKRPAQILGLVAFASACLVWYSEVFRAEHEQHLNLARSDLNNVRREYRLSLEAGDIINTSQQRYRQLQQRGFVGEEPRLLWIESLRSASQRKHLYGLQYKLKQQRILHLAGLDSGEHYQLYASPMQIQMDLAHEVDLLRFFSELDRERAAVYELRGCSLSSTFNGSHVDMDKANVTASCDLAWYTVKPLSALEEEEEQL